MKKKFQSPRPKAANIFIVSP